MVPQALAMFFAVRANNTVLDWDSEPACTGIKRLSDVCRHGSTTRAVGTRLDAKIVNTFLVLMQGLQSCSQDLHVAVSNYEVGCQQTCHETRA